MSEIPPVVPPVAPPATTWFTGLDDIDKGFLQTKGWDKPVAVDGVKEMLKSYRELEGYRGVPVEQLLKVPKDASDEAGWKAVYQRLGAPDKPEGYDFTALDLGDEGLTGKVRDAVRDAAVKFNVPKPMAEEIAKAVAAAHGSHKTATTTEQQALVLTEQAKLKQDWGPNFDVNMFVADKAAERLGVSPEVAAKLKDGMGGAAVAELFRKLGQGMGEDRYVRDPGPGGRDVMTREQAVARKVELLGDMRRGSGDQSFIDRYMKGDAAARREVAALDQMISGGA